MDIGRCMLTRALLSCYRDLDMDSTPPGRPLDAKPHGCFQQALRSPMPGAQEVLSIK